MKTVPRYWWDFNKSKTAIKVESDNDKYPCVGVFSFNESAESAIEDAESLISDLDAGRTTPINVTEE
jgi:hypothetical protein